MWNDSTSGASATINVNGQTKNIASGTNFKEVVLENAREYGLGKFRLFLDEVEILPTAAPELVADGMAIRLVAFDVAGITV